MTITSLLLQIPAASASAEQTDTVAKKIADINANIGQLTASDTWDKIIDSLISFGFKLGIAVLVFLLGKFIIRSLHSWISRVFKKRQTDASLTTFVLSLVKITLCFILIITVIGILGIETSSFLALFASAGVAVGLALSGTLQNFAGGVLILLLKPYKVGDFIEAQGFSGVVKEIQIFNTIINTPDNKAIIIPNGGLSTGSINNYSLEKQRRIDWTIGVAYGTDIDKARAAIMELLVSESRVEKTPEPAVWINELADSSVNLTVRAWVATADYWDVYFCMNELFYKHLPEKGIEFPFPQMDVHLMKSQEAV